jgi:hypothetical protein
MQETFKNFLEAFSIKLYNYEQFENEFDPDGHYFQYKSILFYYYFQVISKNMLNDDLLELAFIKGLFINIKCFQYKHFYFFYYYYYFICSIIIIIY